MSNATLGTRRDGEKRRRLRQDLRAIENRLRRGGLSRRYRRRYSPHGLSLAEMDVLADHVKDLQARAAEIRRLLEGGNGDGDETPRPGEG